MRIATVVCNAILFLFTCVVLVTDGPSNQPAYNLLALLLLAVPVLTIVTVLRSGRIGGAPDRLVKLVTVVCNVVLLACLGWALAAQYPHPQEEGVVAFTLLAVATPILSAVVVSGSLRKPRPA